MAALDEVVAKIYVASFAIYSFGCKNAYEDLKADANDEEHKQLVDAYGHARHSCSTPVMPPRRGSFSST